MASTGTNSDDLNTLVAHYDTLYQPQDNLQRFWVAMLVQSEWVRRDLERQLEANRVECERHRRGLEQLRTRRSTPLPPHRLRLVPRPAR
jgi:hypothetical protein